MISNPIRIGLIDDHALVLHALAERLAREPDLQVVVACDDGERGLESCLAERPDLVLLDLELPGRSSFDLAREMRSTAPAMHILFLTGHLSDVLIDQALQIGIGGYLLKGEPIQTLLESIRRVVRGETCFSQRVKERLVLDQDGHRHAARCESRLSSLTCRQVEVLRHLARGCSVKEVAKVLHLSEKSVDSHKYRIMHKLGIHDRVELARCAIREGLTTP